MFGKFFKVTTWFSSISVLSKISGFQNDPDMNIYENTGLYFEIWNNITKPSFQSTVFKPLTYALKTALLKIHIL